MNAIRYEEEGESPIEMLSQVLELPTKMKSSSSNNVTGGRRSSRSSAPFTAIGTRQSEMGRFGVAGDEFTANTVIPRVEEEEEEERGGRERR
jgi:hypothetical protein